MARSPQEAELFDQIMKRITEKFVSSGEKDRTLEVVVNGLRDSGWVEDVKKLAREEISKCRELSVEDLFEKLRPTAQSLVNTDVKRQLFEILNDFVDKELTEEEITLLAKNKQPIGGVLGNSNSKP